MSSVHGGHPLAGLLGLINDALAVNVYPEGDACVVHVAGELDMASANQLFAAATAGNHPAMVIDLSALSFMDSTGYRSLVASRLVIEQQGRTLSILGQTGGPARLLTIIEKRQRPDAARNTYPTGS